MSELVWPGDARAGGLLDDRSLVAAMTAVESAWLRCLRNAGIAPDINDNLPTVAPRDLESSEASGTPVLPLLTALRARVAEPTRSWLHRGLTSQDVLDTALVLCLRETVDQVLIDVARQVRALSRLADTHRKDVQVARTLGQHAVPTTFGVTAAGWLAGVLDAAEDLARERGRLSLQLGGAAGTLAGVSAFGDGAQLARDLAVELDLQPSPPWHTNRRPVTRVSDALAGCVDAFAKVANDVLLRVRPEVGELAEASGGGSSTMPHKQNPVLSVLVRRAGLLTPHLAAALHTAAASAVDERPDGAWHAEWLPLRLLGRATATAAAQTAELLVGLRVDIDRMRSTAESAALSLLSEQLALTGATGSLDEYLGAAEAIIDGALSRANAFLEGQP